ncbi:MAG: HAMP domain-containing sensor histidine kinase, partial [Planctomycetota bacterium]|jgi:signal transduction histidine kinase|nr:HAMP domain-containing sensor histidine kinase [Planctomycetota bacterium]
MATISFTDTGCGIPEDQLRSIFKPFMTTKQPGQGTGLGLAICQKIVREHGGEIRVDSKVDEGTTFKICLPQS